eukprot:TRINITY_DN14086_c0_g1_i16.p1 TRINITY_DN14086_c0_g1~~TRINITY_DN14086_c0_g1_i16.p1  ORF type:complete len:131 (-),score=16.17 TRINITY_DN14086_c0_g1_i16:84-476(-)
MSSAAIHGSALRCPQPIRPRPVFSSPTSSPSSLLGRGEWSSLPEAVAELGSARLSGSPHSLRRAENIVSLQELALMENELRERPLSKPQATTCSDELCRPENPMVRDRAWGDERMGWSTDGDSDEEFVLV